MTLTLTVQGGDSAPRMMGIDESATIGRAPDCTVALDDAKRGISRIQARIERRGDFYVLVDAGSNPTLLNDEALGSSREAMLADGDRIGIGAYTLAVSLEAEEAAEASHDDSHAHAPFDHTLMTQPAPPSIAPAPMLPETPEFEAPPPAPLIPDDWNATHDSRPVVKKSEAREAPFMPDPLAAAPLLREPGHFGGGADQALLAALSAADPLLENGKRVERTADAPSRSLEHVSPERAMSAMPYAAVAQTAPFDDVSKPVSQPTQPSPPNAQKKREQTQAASAIGNVPPNVPPNATPSPTPRPDRQHESPDNNNASLLEALLEGLGIDSADVAHIPAPDLARLAGSMLREATQGAMSVLRSRAMTKRESRMAMTMIEERDNNPLKFFPDADRALTQMLGARGRGYLPAEEALRAAFHDIQAHELALIAGMRAALDDALTRIDPAAIERSLDAPHGLDALVGNRRARLWQRYVKTWEQVSRDAGDDFQQRFGDPFGRAYQAQLDALHNPKD